MDYKKILQYYFTSEEFDLQLNIFFESYLHYFDPFEPLQNRKKGEKVYLRSQLYTEFEGRMRSSGGVMRVTITPNEFRSIFCSRCGIQKRFAILFAKWWEVSGERVETLFKTATERNCLDYLNFFLCCPNHTRIPVLEEVQFFSYHGTYTAEIYDDFQFVRNQPSMIVPAEQLVNFGFPDPLQMLASPKYEKPTLE